MNVQQLLMIDKLCKKHNVTMELMDEGAFFGVPGIHWVLSHPNGRFSYCSIKSDFFLVKENIMKRVYWNKDAHNAMVKLAEKSYERSKHV